MKNYREMANSVLQRSDEIIRSNQKKRKTAIMAVSALSCCLAVLLGIGVMKGKLTVNPKPETAESTQNHHTTERTSQTVINGVNVPWSPDGTDSTDGRENAPIKIIDRYGSDTSEKYLFPQNGTVLITIPLKEAMEEHGNAPMYRIKIGIVKDGKELVTDKAQLSTEFERICNAVTDNKENQIAFETSTNDKGTFFKISGTVTSDFIENFPASEKYGYNLSLYCTGDVYTEEHVDIINGVCQ